MNVVDIAEFYARPLGKIAQQILNRKLAAALAVTPEQVVVGLGYGLPYLKPEHRSLAFMLARSGVVHWPIQQGVRSALVDELDLPLTESVVDVALVIHALEFSESPQELLNEIWRVLAPQGKLLLVVPNRRGLWSTSDVSPFGQGQPFSRSQILALLKAEQFSVKRIEHALLGPPWGNLALARGFEHLTGTGLERFSGVILIEATKQIYAYSSGKPARRSIARLRPVLLPAGAQATRKT
jgi:SAM-dependent methyltransferase